MSNIVPFDPTSFAQHLKDKVKAEFGSFVPDEAWDRLIQAQVDAFTKNDLPKLIQDELRAEVKTRLGEFFRRPEWQAQWGLEGNTYHGASRALSAVINENLGTLTQVFIGQLMASTAQQAVQRMQQEFSGRVY